MFYTTASAKEEIGQLESQIQGLEADNKAAAEQIAQLQGDLATANENLSAATADLTQVKADLVTANATIEANAEKVKKSEDQEATFSDRVEAGALAKFQSLGGPPVDAGEKKEGDKPAPSSLTGYAKVSAAFAASKK